MQALRHWPSDQLGLIAATYTPFHADGSLNLDAVEAQATALADQRLRGVFVCGSTGEGLSMTTPERMALAQRWCEVAGEDLEVIIHVGHTSAEEARHLAADAERHGAHGIAAVAPSYFRPRNVGELVALNAYIAAGAPNTRYYFYHIPVLSNVDLSMEEFLPQAIEAIPNFAGVKFTHEALATFALLLDRCGSDREVFFGRDEMLLAGLSTGATSAVGSTFNFASPIYHRVFEAFRRNDLETARAEQLVATRMIETVGKYGGLPAFKALMRWYGPDLGPFRLPWSNPDPVVIERMMAELDAQGFFAACPTPVGAAA
jgi:N-acetylneuraminate lyase